MGLSLSPIPIFRRVHFTPDYDGFLLSRKDYCRRPQKGRANPLYGPAGNGGGQTIPGRSGASRSRQTVLRHSVRRTFSRTGRQSCPCLGFHAWTPEDPFLYHATLEMEDDRVECYFAMRKCDIQTGSDGLRRIFLNNSPYMQTGVLDQGYWPDGLYTAPCDEAFIYDIRAMKDLGFNMLRKHIKIEPQRWYYHCDRLGMLVWAGIWLTEEKRYHHWVCDLRGRLP